VPPELFEIEQLEFHFIFEPLNPSRLFSALLPRMGGAGHVF